MPHNSIIKAWFGNTKSWNLLTVLQEPKYLQSLYPITPDYNPITTQFGRCYKVNLSNHDNFDGYNTFIAYNRDGTILSRL